MFTSVEAERLISLEKEIDGDIEPVFLNRRKMSYNLISPEDDNYNFRLDISSNHKITLKAKCHFMESNIYEDLLRIDYIGAHTNPVIVNDYVPEYLKEYAGLRIEVPHMHVYVESYKNLVWAIPLENTDFPVKVLNDINDVSNFISKFAHKINLKTILTFQNSLL